MQSTDQTVYSLPLGSRGLTVFVFFLRIKRLIRVDVYDEDERDVKLSFISSSNVPAGILSRAIEEYFTSGAMPLCYSYGAGEVFCAFARGDACYYARRESFVLGKGREDFIKVPFSFIVKSTAKQIESYVMRASVGVGSMPDRSDPLHLPLTIRKELGADVYSVAIAPTGSVAINVSGVRPFNKRCEVRLTRGDTRSSALGKVFAVMGNRQHIESWLLGTPA